jgi:hypothetical protein
MLWPYRRPDGKGKQLSTSKLIQQCYRLGKTQEEGSFGVAFIVDNRSNENILG